MTKPQTAEIRLLGQKIVLKTSESDPEILQSVIQLVNSHLQEAESRSHSAPPHQVALLALMELAEEYVKAKKRTLDIKQQLDDKNSKLLSLVEADYT